MGNNNSRENDWDSDEGGGSDYEHAYHYHNTVLRKSPADGFESDYEDDDDNEPAGRRQLRALPSRNSANKSSAANQIADGGDGNVRGGGSLTRNQSENSKGHARQLTQSGDAAHMSSSNSGQTERESRAESGKENEVDTENVRAGNVKQTSMNLRQSPGTSRQAADNTRQTADNTRQSAENTRQAAENTRQAAENTRQASDVTQISNNTRQTTNSARQISDDAIQTSNSTQQARQQSQNQNPARESRPREAGREEGGGEENEEEETYETAGEGSENDAADNASDDGSLSTITPPRTRPQSDSDYTVTEDTQEDDNESVEEEEDEEESSEEESDDEVVLNRTSRRNSPAYTQTSRSRASPHTTQSSTTSRSSRIFERSLPRREELSPEAYRQARKRPPNSNPDPPPKRSKTADGIHFSPNRTRYGIFDSESDSEMDNRRKGRKRRAAAPPPSLPSPPPPQRASPESRNVSSRTIRQAARRAATQFMETSRKILREARTAARILKESTSKRRSSTTIYPEEGPSRGKKSLQEKQHARSSSPGMIEMQTLGSSLSRDSPPNRRKGGAKRKLSDTQSPNSRRKQQVRRTQAHSESDSDSDEAERGSSWRQVRKDGGRLRKFTQSSPASSSRPTRSSPRLARPQRANTLSNSLPLAANVTTPPPSSKLNRSFPSAVNPFQNVTLQPSSNTKSTESLDSITHELGGFSDFPSPFSSLTADTTQESPRPLTLNAGSVWARVSARGNVSSQPSGGNQNRVSPIAGTSGTRMATRTSPSSSAADYPAHSTPRVPSLTLTGQFSQNGRFAFLLEDVLQVTVVTDTITSATTNAIVITTDSRLQHSNPAAKSVAAAAGKDFASACQQYLRQNSKGLQVCEVLDTPAGGHLSPLISRVLQVIVPETETSSAQGISQQRKLLLCTYVNCLKRASEKLKLLSVAFPLIGSGTYSADECIQVFFDALLVYLAERTPDCPLHAVQLIVHNPALARFSAEVLEARLQALKASSVDVAMAAVFRDYFNIPDFTRSNNLPGVVTSSPQGSAERSPSGKPAVKRRRL